jgi:hypothetical protein
LLLKFADAAIFLTPSSINKKSLLSHYRPSRLFCGVLSITFYRNQSVAVKN